MSLQERIDRLKNQNPPPGENPPSPDNPPPKEPAESTRIIEALGFDDILHQIRDDVWQSGAVTKINEYRDPNHQEQVSSSISLYDVWPQREYSARPSLSIVVGQIPANRFDQKPVFLAKVISLNEPKKESKRWAWEKEPCNIFLFTESQIALAKQRIEDHLLKDCLDRQERGEVPYTQKRIADVKAAPVTPEALEEILRKGEPFSPFSEYSVNLDSSDWKKLTEEAYKLWGDPDTRRQHFILERSKRPNAQDDETEIPAGESLEVEGAEITVLQTYIGRDLRVTIRIKNLSRPILNYSSSDFMFLAPDGRMRSGFYKQYGRNLESGILLKGGIVEDSLSFEVWPSEKENLMSDLYLVLEDSQLSEKTFFFELI